MTCTPLFSPVRTAVPMAVGHPSYFGAGILETWSAVDPEIRNLHLGDTSSGVVFAADSPSHQKFKSRMAIFLDDFLGDLHFRKPLHAYIGLFHLVSVYLLCLVN